MLQWGGVGWGGVLKTKSTKEATERDLKKHLPSNLLMSIWLIISLLRKRYYQQILEGLLRVKRKALSIV